jgi:hypothetical protein
MHSNSKCQLRTVYIDDYVDRALTAHSLATGLTKAAAFRLWLDLGIRAARQGQLRPVAAPSSPLILKTVYLDPKVDALIRVEAFDSHVKQNDVLRRYVQAGLEVSLSGSGSV